jgi:hypothetical protein
MELFLVPTVEVGDVHIMELFHGPTSAYYFCTYFTYFKIFLNCDGTMRFGVPTIEVGDVYIMELFHGLLASRSPRSRLVPTFTSWRRSHHGAVSWPVHLMELFLLPTIEVGNVHIMELSHGPTFASTFYSYSCFKIFPNCRGTMSSSVPTGNPGDVHADVVPTVEVGDVHIVELFQAPTFAPTYYSYTYFRIFPNWDGTMSSSVPTCHFGDVHADVEPTLEGGDVHIMELFLGPQ